MGRLPTLAESGALRRRIRSACLEEAIASGSAVNDGFRNSREITFCLNKMESQLVCLRSLARSCHTLRTATIAVGCDK
jgi:hypothetical protein